MRPKTSNMLGILSTSFLAMSWTIAAAESEQGDEPDPVFVAPEVQQRISALAANPRVQDALAHVVAIESFLHSDHIELTEIPAPARRRQKSIRRNRFRQSRGENGPVT